MMRWLYYTRRWFWDRVRYSPLCGELAALGLHGRAALMRDPQARLELLARAARICSSPRHLRRLETAMHTDLERLPAEAIDWQAAGAGAPERDDIPKGIILKPPVSEQEKGVLYITFEDQWLRILRSGRVADMAQRYDIVLGPSASPPPDVALLLAAKLWPGRVYTLVSNLGDIERFRRLSPKLEPIPLLASSWVDPDAYGPYLHQSRDYDIVMLAHFDLVKRHWLFFDMLRRLPRHLRVLLMGVPLSGRTEVMLRDEARLFGVADRFDLVVKPTREQVAEGLCRSRVSLLFSQQEGSCIAIAESLLADTPVGVFRSAHIGSKAFLNEQTGILLDRARLAEQVLTFVASADNFRARAWALENISCHVSRRVLNDFLCRAAHRDQRPWTRDLEAIAQHLVPCYLTQRTEDEMRPWYDDFTECYGLRLGPAARTPASRSAALSGNTPAPVGATV
jgi:hypothetical protein